MRARGRGNRESRHDRWGQPAGRATGRRARAGSATATGQAVGLAVGERFSRVEESGGAGAPEGGVQLEHHPADRLLGERTVPL